MISTISLIAQQHPWWFGFLDGALFAWIVIALVDLVDRFFGGFEK